MKDLKGNDKLDWMAIGMIQLASEVKDATQFDDLIDIRGKKYNLDDKAIGTLQYKAKNIIKEMGYSYRGDDTKYETQKLLITVNEKADKLFGNITYGTNVYNEKCRNGYKIKNQECINKMSEGINTVKNWIEKYDPTINNLNTTQYPKTFEKYFRPNNRPTNKNKFK